MFTLKRTEIKSNRHTMKYYLSEHETVKLRDLYQAFSSFFLLLAAQRTTANFLSTSLHMYNDERGRMGKIEYIIAWLSEHNELKI